MDKPERLRYCKACIHKEVDKNSGIICKLNKEKPSFTGICSDYDPIDENKLIEVKKLDLQIIAQKGKAKAKIALSFFLFVSLIHIVINFHNFGFIPIVLIPSILGFIFYLMLSILIIKGKTGARIWLSIIIGLRMISIINDFIRYFDEMKDNKLVFGYGIALFAVYGYIIFLLYGDKQFSEFINQYRSALKFTPNP